MVVSINDGNSSLRAISDLKTSIDLMMLSSEMTRIITFVNFSVFCTSIAIFGIVANIINIVVFVKQGFKDTVNVSLCTLAMADLASLVFLAWVGTCFNPYLKRLTLPFEPTQVVYLTGGQPRLYFTRVAGWITSVVAFERCLCVLKPMQVKLIFTKDRIVFVLVFIFIAASLTMVPVYYTTRLTWKLDSAKNRTYLGLSFIDDRHKVDRVSFTLGVTVTMSAFVIVTSCTIILGWSLMKQSRWRAKMVMETNVKFESKNQESRATEKEQKGKKRGDRPEISSRDRQAVKTVTFIAVMFVVCYFPNVLNLTLMSIFPEYNKDAKYQNIFFVVWSFAQMAEGFCSSANIFVYYQTSTKYKETLTKSLRGNAHEHAGNR